MNYPDTIIIPRTLCQDDVENYFSLQRARIASGQPTVLPYFESASTLSTDLLLGSEFGDLQDSIGSYDPVSMLNITQIPLLRRHKRKGSSDPNLYSSATSDLTKSFIPPTNPQCTYDKAQKLRLLGHAMQTLEYIDLSTSSTIIQANQAIVHAMKSEINSQNVLDFISCLDHGLRVSYFNPENWSENTLKEALIDEVKTSI